MTLDAERVQATQRTIAQGNEYGIHLYQVSVHDTDCEVCLQYQGKVFSCGGEEGFPVLGARPPFHDRCRHVLMPYVPRPGKEDKHRALKLLSNRPEPIANGLAGYDEAVGMVISGQEPKTVFHVLSLHSILSRKIRDSYRLRNSPGAFEQTIEHCKEQIAIAPQVAEALRKANPDAELAEHIGFKRLAIIREKEQAYDEGIQLCEVAMRQGWGDTAEWATRIARLAGRQIKRSRTKD